MRTSPLYRNDGKSSDFFCYDRDLHQYTRWRHANEVLVNQHIYSPGEHGWAPSYDDFAPPARLASSKLVNVPRISLVDIAVTASRRRAG